MELAIKYNKMSNNDLYDLTMKVRIITRTRMSDTLINFFKKNLEYITSEANKANKVYKNKTKEIFDAFVADKDILEGIEGAVDGNLFMMYDTSSAEETAYLDANEAEKIILLKIKKSRLHNKKTIRQHHRKDYLLYEQKHQKVRNRPARR